MPAWCVYLLECEDGSLYTGIATDPHARYAAHTSGRGARYTRARPPQKLLGWWPLADRAAASRTEYAVKQLAPQEKRALMARRGACPDAVEAATLPPPCPTDMPMQRIRFDLDRDHVELNQLLKLVGVCDSGGQGKAIVASGAVQVDGEVELRKTCKIRVGQVVRVDDTEIEVVGL